MSDQRPEWMPSKREFIGAIDLDSYLPGKTDFPNTIKVVRRTGLRAQIAVLEFARRQVICCPEVVAVNEIDNKIAALRKELK